MNRHFYVFAAFIFETLPRNFYISSKLQKNNIKKKTKKKTAEFITKEKGIIFILSNCQGEKYLPRGLFILEDYFT